MTLPEGYEYPAGTAVPCVSMDAPHIQAILADLYDKLPDPPYWMRSHGDMIRPLLKPVKPHPDYPWIDCRRVESLEDGPLYVRARKASQFRRHYGFEWRLGPNNENERTCLLCLHIYCKPVGHNCAARKLLPAS